MALEKEAVIDTGVQIAKLPRPNAPCPNGMNMVVSGWGSYVFWASSEPFLGLGFDYLGAGEHKFLWAVKQKCVPMDFRKCGENAGTLIDPDSLICGIGPDFDTGMNGPYRGDSGGKYK